MFQSLVYFRQDLRLSDQPALWQARQRGDCIGLAILCEQQWLSHDDAACKINFYLRQLHCLKDSLEQLNIPLIIVSLKTWQQIPAYIHQLCQQLNIDTVYSNAELAPNERQRDQAIAQYLAQHDCQLHIYHERTLFPPATIRNQQQQPYQIFSAFKKQCYQRLEHALPKCYPLPEAQADIALPAALLALDGDQLLANMLKKYPCRAEMLALWPVGEAAAQQQLQDFIHDHVSNYAQQRDYPAQAATSQLSAYLNIGILSVRQCLEALFAAYQGQLHFEQQGQQVWFDELLWREFYQHILFDYPKVGKHQAFQSHRQGLIWRDAPQDYQAWCTGQTGIPIVDAGMRQLLATGWMHNRVRMICAMFLSKNLLIDWRLGERWFMQHLIDGDLAANNGGWQWSASTGTDAVPYFRIFNPISQSKRFDPEGEYLKRWLPELGTLDHRQIHEPYAKNKQLAGIDYPQPIVDLKASRQRALQHFAST